MTDQVREFTDTTGLRWKAQLVSQGRTSGYLNPRVHNPIVQFECLDARRPTRYTGYPAKEARALDRLSDEEIRWLWVSSTTH